MNKLLPIAIAFVLVLSGCASQTTPTVTRGNPNEINDLSGEWNDTDSRLVSEEMVRDLLSRPWLQQHVAQAGGNPSVIVGQVRNLSHEHVNTQTFINDIERELINSGRIIFVANSTERRQLRDERLDQDINASEQTRKEMGQELGADYMLIGDISTIVDAAGKTQVTYYQVDLKMVSLTDNRTMWVGQKKIKKIIKGRKARY